LDFVPLPAGLFGEGAIRSELEILVQVVEQSAVILELDVDVGEHEVEGRIVGSESDCGHGECFGFGGAVQLEEYTG
jgi:hypothetical protein